MSINKNIENGVNSLASLQEAGLSDAGILWLEKVLDLYQDLPSLPTGLPDDFYGKTIVREISVEMPIDPSNFRHDVPDPSLGWECHINMTSLMKTISMQSNANFRYDPPTTNGYTFGAPTLDFPRTMSMFNVNGYPTGYPSTNSVWPDPALSNAYTLYDTITANPLEDLLKTSRYTCEIRVLGVAFEVLNLTPEMYKTGEMTCYRRNTCFDREAVQAHFRVYHAGTPAYAATTLSTRHVATPPNQVSYVYNLPNTRTFLAKDGCYCTGVMDLQQLSEFTNPHEQVAIVARYDPGHAISQPVTTNCYIYPYDAAYISNKDLSTSTTDGSYRGIEWIPTSALQTQGVFITGLNEWARFKLRMRVLFETIPSELSSDLVLAKASAEYDPKALELYAKIVRILPAGVPQTMNDMGAWFASVMDILAKIAVPLGGLISTGVTGSPAPGIAIASAGVNLWNNLGSGLKRRQA